MMYICLVSMIILVVKNASYVNIMNTIFTIYFISKTGRLGYFIVSVNFQREKQSVNIVWVKNIIFCLF